MLTTVKNTSLNETQKRFLRSLSVNAVRYLIIGGYAVGYHGHPRFTRDLDIWVGTDADNAEAIVKALNHYGTPYMFTGSFETPDNVVQLGEPPHRIDILTTVNGVTFNEAYPKGETLFVNELEVRFVDLESLIKSKTATGRARDAADIEALAM